MIYSGGKRTLLWGNYHFWVMNDHLWGSSVHVDKSFTKIQARVRPPPIPAMPEFWEFLFRHPFPKLKKQWNVWKFTWYADIFFLQKSPYLNKIFVERPSIPIRISDAFYLPLITSDNCSPLIRCLWPIWSLPRSLAIYIIQWEWFGVQLVKRYYCPELLCIFPPFLYFTAQDMSDFNGPWNRQRNTWGCSNIFYYKWWRLNHSNGRS